MNAEELHYRKLEQMYATAPVNDVIPCTVAIEHGRATVTVTTGPHLWHAAGSLHGSMYFKGLDDAAFFAAQSAVLETFVLTAHFQLDLLGRVTGSELRAEGTLLNIEGRTLTAKAELFDETGTLVASGEGVFVKSGVRLDTIDTYALL